MSIPSPTKPVGWRVPGAARDDGNPRAIPVGADDDLEGGNAVEPREPAVRERDQRVDGLDGFIGEKDGH